MPTPPLTKASRCSGLKSTHTSKHSSKSAQKPSGSASSSSTPSSTACPSAPATIEPTGDGVSDNIYFKFNTGYGVVEKTDNIGNTDPEGHPPVTYIISGDVSVDVASTACAYDAARGHYGSPYLSFDLHFNIPAGHWECVEYYQSTADDVTGYNVVDKNVGCEYGYAALGN